MEEEWRLYLKEHAPELYEKMLGSVSWAAEWRDKKITELKGHLENAEQEVEDRDSDIASIEEDKAKLEQRVEELGGLKVGDFRHEELVKSSFEMGRQFEEERTNKEAIFRAGQEDMQNQCDKACTKVIESCSASTDSKDHSAASGASICRAQIRGLAAEAGDPVLAQLIRDATDLIERANSFICTQSWQDDAGEIHIKLVRAYTDLMGMRPTPLTEEELEWVKKRAVECGVEL